MRLPCGIGLLALALLWSHAAAATDLSLSLEGGAEYDSNVRRTETNVQDDVLFQLIPGVRIHQERSHDLNFNIHYSPRFEFAVENGSELNDIDQYLDAEILYSPTGRLDFFLRDDFRYLRSTLRERRTLDSIAIPIISSGRDRVTLNLIEGGASYQLTPRLAADLEVAHRLFETTRADRSDARRIAARLDVLYRMDRRQRLGFGLTFGHDSFTQTPEIVGSETDGIVAFVRWRYEVTGRISIDVRAGPAFYLVNQNEPKPGSAPLVPFTDDPNDPDSVQVFAEGTCDPSPVIGDPDRVFSGCDVLGTVPRVDVENLMTQLTNDPASNSGDPTQRNIDALVSVDIARNWSETFRTNVRYGRTPGVASGLGGTVIRDSVTLGANWGFAPSWQFLARGDWVLRKSLSNSLGIYRRVIPRTQPLPGTAQFAGSQFRAPTDRSQVDTQSWSALARVSYQFRRKTTVFLQGTYDAQRSLGDSLASGTDFDDWIVTFGVVYTFDPFPLGF